MTKIRGTLKSILTPIVKRNEKLYSILKSISESISNKQISNYGIIHKLIDSLSESNKNIFFLQIGSNDGVTGDPIHQFVIRNKWSGILVEPVEYVFDRLVNNYRGQNKLIFENVAISDKNEKKDFWYLKKTEDDLPFYYDQLGSFYKSVVMKHRKSIPNIETFLVKKQITCIPLPELLRKHNVQKIDLIHIDTEGYDFEVIRQIDFDTFDPLIILFEHKHLCESDLNKCLGRLFNKGYSLIQEGGNTIAFKSCLLKKFEAKHRVFAQR